MRHALGLQQLAGSQRCVEIRPPGRLALRETPQQIGVEARAAQRAAQPEHHVHTRQGLRQSVGYGIGLRLGCRRLAQARACADPARQRRPQLRRVDGFGHVVVHAHGEAALAIGLHRVGGHGDHRQVGEAGVGPQQARGSLAVHHGHLHVHEHHVVAFALQGVERLLAMRSHVYRKTGIAQQLHGDELVQLVVLDQQHRRTPHRGQQCLLLRVFQAGAASQRLADGGHGLHQGLEQHGRADRLDQHRLDALRARRVHDILAPIGRDHEHLRHGAKIQRPDAPRQLDAVHARHMPIQQQQAVRVPLGHRIAHRGQRLLARMHLLGLQAQRLQHVAQHRGGGVVVVHHQHPPPLQCGGAKRALRRRLAQVERHRGPEARALARLAFCPHIPAHQQGQLAADGQAQASAAIAARSRAVGLLEALEQAPHLLGRNADAGVAHLEAQ